MPTTCPQHLFQPTSAFYKPLGKAKLLSLCTSDNLSISLATTSLLMVTIACVDHQECSNLSQAGSVTSNRDSPASWSDALREALPAPGAADMAGRTASRVGFVLPPAQQQGLCPQKACLSSESRGESKSKAINICQQHYLLPSQKPLDFLANGSHMLLPTCPMAKLASLHLSCLNSLSFNECFYTRELPRNVLPPWVNISSAWRFWQVS